MTMDEEFDGVPEEYIELIKRMYDEEMSNHDL